MVMTKVGMVQVRRDITDRSCLVIKGEGRAGGHNWRVEEEHSENDEDCGIMMRVSQKVLPPPSD